MPIPLRLLTWFAAAASALLGADPALGQTRVPTFREVSGHAFGERITQHHEMVRYLERLAETSPRVSIVDQGTSWEGRRLLFAIVTSPENHGRLAKIRETARRLADPRITSKEQAKSLITSQPAVVWLGGSIHGFELSGSEGLLKLLEHLTIRNDQETRDALESTVVLIDPILNPDGRDAFAQKNVSFRQACMTASDFGAIVVGVFQNSGGHPWRNERTTRRRSVFV